MWRQRVIVARQPDHSKMAELTGTGKKRSFTLVLSSLWQVYSPPRPQATHLIVIIHPIKPLDTATVYCRMTEKKKKRSETDRKGRVGWNIDVLCTVSFH